LVDGPRLGRGAGTKCQSYAVELEIATSRNAPGAVRQSGSLSGISSLLSSPAWTCGVTTNPPKNPPKIQKISCRYFKSAKIPAKNRLSANLPSCARRRLRRGVRLEEGRRYQKSYGTGGTPSSLRPFPPFPSVPRHRGLPSGPYPPPPPPTPPPPPPLPTSSPLSPLPLLAFGGGGRGADWSRSEHREPASRLARPERAAGPGGRRMSRRRRWPRTAGRGPGGARGNARQGPCIVVLAKRKKRRERRNRRINTTNY